jgi:hypothetical protein
MFNKNQILDHTWDILDCMLTSPATTCRLVAIALGVDGHASQWSLGETLVDNRQCRTSLHIVVRDAGQERRGCKNLKTHDPLCSLCYRFAVMTHLNNPYTLRSHLITTSGGYFDCINRLYHKRID